MTHGPLRVNLIGFGTVGQALANLLLERELSGGANELRIVAITDRGGTLANPEGIDLREALSAKAEGCSVAAGEPPESLANLARTVDADVVVDLLPTDLRTGELSRDVAHSALLSGRHVVIAGKGLLALHAASTQDLARATGRCVLSSASVLGGTPALELLSSAFRGDRLTRFQGVLNGSTNLILSHLEQGASWEYALREARDAGVLEADPTLDLHGLDAAAKAIILANHAWGHAWTLADAHVEGIQTLEPAQVESARAQGLAVRLVATACPKEGVSVAPLMLPRDHPLVVHGAENALRLELAAAGAVLLRGPGAGGRETASAVLSDLLAIAAGRDAPGAPLAAPPLAGRHAGRGFR